MDRKRVLNLSLIFLILVLIVGGVFFKGEILDYLIPVEAEEAYGELDVKVVDLEWKKEASSQDVLDLNRDYKYSYNSNDREEREESRFVTLLAAGDAMYHMPQVRGAKTANGFDFNNNFKYLKPYFEGTDFGIINFETVAEGNQHGFSGYPSFNAPVETLDSIKNAGFNIINMANNHILDRGKSGALNTVRNALDRDLKPIGTNLEGQNRYLIEEVNGIRLGFLSYTYGYNGHEARFSKEELDSFTNKIDEGKIKKDLEFLRGQVDFIVTYIHWGEEYQSRPNASQKALAEKIFSWGGDIILGSHPHVIQPARSFTIDGNDKYIIYSLGNFISNQRTETLNKPATEDGLLLKLTLELDPYNKKHIVEKEHIATWVNKYNGDKTYFEILPIDRVLSGDIRPNNYSEAMLKRLKASKNRTIESLNR